MKPRVLHILSGDSWGGKEAQVLLQLEALVQLGWEVRVLLFNQGQTRSAFESKGLDVVLALESNGFRTLLSSAVSQLKDFNPALIVSHGYKESFVAQKLRCVLHCPWVVTFHGYSEQFRGLKKGKIVLLNALHRILAKFFAKKIVSVSKALAAELGFSRSAKLAVVHNVAPIVERSEDVLELQKPELFSETEAVVVIVGRLVEGKGLELGIQAFSNLLEKRRAEGRTEAVLYIIGEGPLKESLQQTVAQLKLTANVVLAGFQKQASLLIKHSDVLFLPSEREGIPSVLLEAMVHSVPVVASALPGIEEALAHFPTYPAKLLKQRSAQSFSGALDELLETSRADEDAQRSNLAILNKHFSPQAAAQTLDALYRQIAKV